MNKKMYFLIFFILVILSCEKETEWTFKSTENYIVIDGILTNEKKNHIIKLSNSLTNINEDIRPVSGAIVAINNGDSLHTLTEYPKKSGLYRTNSDYIAVLNKTYSLYIYYEGINYRANANMTPVTPFNKLQYKLNTENNLYFIDSITQSFSSNESAMYKITIDWSNLPEYANTPLDEKKATLYYYTLQTIDISQVFAPEQEIIYFPKGSKITETKFSLSSEHASFIRSMLFETEWRGGFFDVKQANVNSNISNGGLGFFGICTVLKDSLIVE